MNTSPTPLPTVHDALARPLRDLRISVTDRCNFRCPYCMPRALFGPDHAFLPRAALLSFEEIFRLAQVFVHLGVNKLRLTGGEPLLRRDLERLVAQLATLTGVELAMTTNGVLLGRKAQALRAAGLTRLTVSLDALDDATFLRMNDAHTPVAEVLAGIEAAQRAGFTGLKINAVIQRGVNEHAVLDLARHFRGTGMTVRFIEYMDVGSSNGWRPADVFSAQDMLALLRQQWVLQPVTGNPHAVAQEYRYADGAGTVGLIAAVTQPFCQHCTRLRLSTDGQLFTCLFAGTGFDVKTLLRADLTDQALAEHLGLLWQQRQDQYSQLRFHAARAQPPKEMSYLGG